MLFQAKAIAPRLEGYNVYDEVVTEGGQLADLVAEGLHEPLPLVPGAFCRDGWLVISPS